MSKSPTTKDSHYPDDHVPAFTPVNQHQTAQPVNPNPAYRPPQRERPRANIFDIPDLDNEQLKPRPKNGKRVQTVSTTPLRLSQAATPPDSKKQATKTSHRQQTNNTKSFQTATVSKPSFQQHRSHSNGGQTSSNIFPGAPPATPKTTTMQSGIAMTTMQKLAAYRYQPSSTGSVHKAVAPTALARSEAVSTHVGRTALPATTSPAEADVHTSAKGGYQKGGRSKSLTLSGSLQAHDYSSYLNELPRTLDGGYLQTDLHQPGPGMEIPQFGADSTYISGRSDLPQSATYHREKPTLFLRVPISSSPLGTEPSVARTPGYFVPHTTDQSDAKLSEWNSEYDSGLNSDDFRSLELDDGHSQGFKPLPMATDFYKAVMPNPLRTTTGRTNHYEHHAATHLEDEMLDYGVFEDLTAQPWDHMDYGSAMDRSNENRTNHSIQVENMRIDDMEIDTSLGVECCEIPDINQGNNGDALLVYSHDQIPNAELSITRDGLVNAHVDNAARGEATEDFAPIGDLDDDDLLNVALPLGAEDKKETAGKPKEAPGNAVAEPAEEDYLAAFGEFTDEDFKGVEILSGNAGTKELPHDLMAPSHIVQVPETEYATERVDKNCPDSVMLTMATSLPALPRCSRDDNSEDEYPLDEDEQADLEELITSKHQHVLETKEPPSSLLRSEEDMRDMDRYDKTLKYSPVVSSCVPEPPEGSNANPSELHEPLTDPEDWEFLRENGDPLQTSTASGRAMYTSCTADNGEHSFGIPDQAESDNSSPLSPFARPRFPAAKVTARTSVTGLSSNIVLRTCFRIGEALSQASLCTRANQDAVTELFARVTFSERESDGKKQKFQFGDIFHNKPPFISGVLEKCASSDLQKTESSELITGDKQKEEDELGQMVRVLGRVKRVMQGRGYTMDILNIRKTDWEEVRWTKRILSPLDG